MHMFWEYKIITGKEGYIWFLLRKIRVYCKEILKDCQIRDAFMYRDSEFNCPALIVWDVKLVKMMAAGLIKAKLKNKYSVFSQTFPVGWWINKC